MTAIFEKKAVHMQGHGAEVLLCHDSAWLVEYGSLGVQITTNIRGLRKSQAGCPTIEEWCSVEMMNVCMYTHGVLVLSFFDRPYLIQVRIGTRDTLFLIGVWAFVHIL